MKPIYILLLSAGIILRFILQFCFPTFNIDEISLGNNIKYSSFIELIYPLKYGQSCPPLCLWLQKGIVEILPFSFLVEIKLISFFSSILGIIFFFILLTKRAYRFSYLLIFIILLFNPFIVYNSLTLKQYTIDLTGVLYLLLVFKSDNFKKHGWILFLFWSLISNVGSFACAGYLAYSFSKQLSYNRSTVISYLRRHILFVLAVVPYFLYFIWFMQQKGAKELKGYMSLYWHDSFIPLNSNIFKYIIYTVHGIWIYVFSAFEIWGIILILLTIPIIINFKKREFAFIEEIKLLFFVLMVHLTLNILHMYPFSDRLYLYLTPLFILMLGSSVDSLQDFKRIKPHFFKLNCLIIVITFGLYLCYLPYTENDVNSVYRRLDRLNQSTIYVTPKSLDCFEKFDRFTDHELKSQKKYVLIDSTLDKSQYIVSRVAKKIKYNVTAPEEATIQNLLAKNRIKKIDGVNGYNIYLVK